MMSGKFSSMIDEPLPSLIAQAGSPAVNAWTTWLGGFTPSTSRQYRYSAVRFLNWLEPQGIGLSQITPQLIDQYFDFQKTMHSSKAMNRSLSPSRC